MFGSIFFLFRLNRQFGLIVLCAFPFIVGCLAWCLWKANPMFTKLQGQLDKINSIMQERRIRHSHHQILRAGNL